MKKIVLLVVIICFHARILSAQEKDKPFVYNDNGKRDPFWSLVSPSGAILNYDNDLDLGDLSLQGVIAGNEGQNMAIINGKVLKLHDKIGEFEIIEIENDFITIKKGEEETILKLKKGGLE